MPHSLARALPGLITIVGVVAFAANMSRGGFNDTSAGHRAVNAQAWA